MPEQKPPESHTPDSGADDGATLLWLRQPLESVLPLVDDLLSALGRLLLLSMLFGLGIIGWVVWELQLAWGWVLVISGMVGLPVLILARVWWALHTIQSLPATLQEAAASTTQTVTASFKAAPADHRGALNIPAQARRLWELRGLLQDSAEALRGTLSLGVLLNPVSLLLTFLALLGALTILFAGLIIVLTIVC